MTSVAPIGASGLAVENGDITATQLVNGATLDTNLQTLRANIDAVNAAVSVVIRDDNLLVDSAVKLRSLDPEVIALLGSGAGNTGIVWQPKAQVDCASTANLTLSGEQTIDGFVTSGSRVLVKDQTLGQNNGIYVTAAGAWTRSTDTDTAAEMGYALCYVVNGTSNTGTSWVCTFAAAAIVLGTTVLVFGRLPSANLNGVATVGHGGTGQASPQNWPTTRRRMVHAVSVANIASLSAPGATIDGVTLAAGDRILLTAQTTTSQNGIWVWNGAAGLMTRPVDYPSADTVLAYKDIEVLVYSGTVYGGAVYRLSTTGTITIDATPTAWVLVTSAPITTPLVISTVDTIAALKAVAVPTSGWTVLVRGYYAIADHGGGEFWWNSSDTTADNGGTVVALNSGGTGRWNRVYSGAINVAWFGTRGDGTTDDTASINAAIAVLPTANVVPKLVFQPGLRYVIGTSTAIGAYAITIDRLCTIDFSGATLVFKGVDGANGIQVNASEVVFYQLKILKPTYSTTDATLLTGVGVQYLSNATRPAQKCRNYDMYVEGFQYGLSMQGTLAGVAYNDFYSPRLKNNFIGVVCDSTDNANSYCTTLNFSGGEISIFLDPGAIYTGSRNIDIRNSNTFHFAAQIFFDGVVVEGHAERKIKCAGAYCQFNHLDYDATNGGTDIEFTSTSKDCQIFGGGALDDQTIINQGTNNWLYGTSKGIAASRQLNLQVFDAGFVRRSAIAYDVTTDVFKTGLYQQSRYATTQAANSGVPVSIPVIADGIIQVQCDVECAIFFVRGNTVTKLTGTTNTANTNTAAKLCVYPNGGTEVRIIHNLGGTKNLTIIANYL